MKRKIILFILITCLALSVVALSSCAGTVESVAKKIDKSIGNAKTLTQILTVTDGSATVYSLTKTVTVENDTVNVTVDEATLGDDFTLQHNVTTQTSDKAEQLVSPLNLTDEHTISSEYNNGMLTCVYDNDGAKELFGNAEMSVDGNVNVQCVLVGNKLMQMTCTFTTTSAKSVTLIVTCAY